MLLQYALCLGLPLLGSVTARAFPPASGHSPLAEPRGWPNDVAGESQCNWDYGMPTTYNDYCFRDDQQQPLLASSGRRSNEQACIKDRLHDCKADFGKLMDAFENWFRFKTYADKMEVKTQLKAFAGSVQKIIKAPDPGDGEEGEVEVQGKRYRIWKLTSKKKQDLKKIAEALREEYGRGADEFSAKFKKQYGNFKEFVKEWGPIILEGTLEGLKIIGYILLFIFIIIAEAS